MIVTLHSGFEDVYWSAESAIALLVSQPPSAAISPTILIVWPYCVVTSSLKVTATEVAAAHAVDVVLDVDEDPVARVVEELTVPVGTPVVGVWLAGKLVAVAEVYDPWMEVA